MDFLTIAKGRRSIRAYKDADIEEDKLQKILEAARLAPSASNRQEWKFVVVKNKETRKKLARAAFNQSFVAEAPVVIVACATETNSIMSCGQPAYTVDLSIACTHIILQAYELGLGTCWLGAFKENEVKNILKIPENVRVVTMTPVGYPDQPPSQGSRKSLKQIVCFEQYVSD
ncbi:MAG TPA: nitroreductase family protein [Thermodesulfobacteriota bacterium]|nr:nitroreductase family protein [Thermodesulfobacteriota bacterium]